MIILETRKKKDATIKQEQIIDYDGQFSTYELILVYSLKARFENLLNGVVY